jgi:hypothetical protein
MENKEENLKRMEAPTRIELVNNGFADPSQVGASSSTESVSESEESRSVLPLSAQASLRIVAILEGIAHEIRPCKACQAPLYFVRTQRGSVIPYTREGVNHFEDCPDRERFKRDKPRQAALFDRPVNSRYPG